MNNGNEMDRLSMRLSRFGDFSLEQLKSLNMNVRHQFSNLRDFNNIRKWSPVNCHQQSYNLCTPFKYDIRCASLCGVEFVVTKKRREKRAQHESYLKGVRRLPIKELVVFKFQPSLAKILTKIDGLFLWCHTPVTPNVQNLNSSK